MGMGIAEVKRFLQEHKFPRPVIEHGRSTATVEKAAETLGVEEKLIAKTLTFNLKDRHLIVVTRGDARIDNRKFKNTFNKKPRMLNPDEVEEITGHPVGGVCPFGLKNPLDIYLDVSLQEFDYIYPAAGGANTSLKITPEELKQISEGSWVDVCQ
jgi:Cys-tRNA(Pro) deacylase